LRDLPEAVLVYQEHGQTGRDYLVTGDGQLTANTQRWFEMNDIRFHENRRPAVEDLHHSVRVGVVATGQRAFEVEAQVTERFGDRISLHCFAGVPTTAKEDAVFIVEIFAAGVNKWRGVSWLAEQHGIAPEAVAAVGDEINDLAMLQHAGLGVAMGNAVERAAAVADRHTHNNTDHGVAHAIRQMLDGAW
ncbi:MAG: HAD hydrolase family protein, partial [Planctomycetota bacterium]